MQQEPHPRDDELMLAIDGELGGSRARELDAHLASCWNCRVRRSELERSIEQFVRLRARAYSPSIPPAEGPAARLRAELAQLSVQSSPAWRTLLQAGWRRYALPVALGSVAVTVSIVGLTWMTQQRANAGPLPDSSLTPGATRLISATDVCTLPPDDDTRRVPVELAHRVFRQYRIVTPKPRAFEVDYLISPTLGGADDIRNLWPQPYAEGVWNSRVKDALEDHLRRLVCEGTMDLSDAQQEIAANWIAAYQKHFRTKRPLAAHALFVKDRPWE